FHSYPSVFRVSALQRNKLLFSGICINYIKPLFKPLISQIPVMGITYNSKPWSYLQTSVNVSTKNLIPNIVQRVIYISISWNIRITQTIRSLMNHQYFIQIGRNFFGFNSFLQLVMPLFQSNK